MADEDRQAIAGLVATYLDGLYHCDVERLSRVFHPRALYATACGPEPLMLTMDEYFPIVAQRDPPARTRAQRDEAVLALDLLGPSTALVKLRCSFFGKAYLDLLSLVRIEGRWQIIAKVFHFEALPS